VAAASKILVVDDTPHNRKLLADILQVKGYAVSTAASGPEALAVLERERPDLVLLDVVMPEMSGYEVCEQIRRNPETRLLPVVMVTALEASEERVKSIEAGADDFLSKPINTQELLARVRSLLRIKELHDTVQHQAGQLAEWNTLLEHRVGEQVGELERLGHLKRFLPPQLAAMIAEGGMGVLEPHRRRVVVAFVDLRGFTPFAESAEPEEVMDVLSDYHAVMGRLIIEHEGTLERFTGDGLVIVFNDPVEQPNPEERATRMAVAMRDAAVDLRDKWRRLGHDMHVGIGMTLGYAMLGMIGFEGRRDYAAIGSVMNQASRLCAAAEGGQILVSDSLLSTVETLVEAEPVGELTLKGFRRPVMTYSMLRLKG
jgi:adenylate cyclase